MVVPKSMKGQGAFRNATRCTDHGGMNGALEQGYPGLTFEFCFLVAETVQRVHRDLGINPPRYHLGLEQLVVPCRLGVRAEVRQVSVNPSIWGEVPSH